MLPSDVPPLAEAVLRFERWYLVEALRIGRTIARAAQIARMHRQNFYKALRDRRLLGDGHPAQH